MYIAWFLLLYATYYNKEITSGKFSLTFKTRWKGKSRNMCLWRVGNSNSFCIPQQQEDKNVIQNIYQIFLSYLH